MPDVKVYIREENMDKWKAIQGKSAWVNAALSSSLPTPPQPAGIEHDTEQTMEVTVQPTPFATKSLWTYDGLDLHNFCYRPSNNTVYEIGTDEHIPYDGADTEMVNRLKQLGLIWRG